MNNISSDIKKDFENRLANGSEAQILNGLIGIGMYLDDYEYVINTCKRLSLNKNPVILRGVIFALGHLAGNFGVRDENFYNSIINKGLSFETTIDVAQDLKEDFNL